MSWGGIENALESEEEEEIPENQGMLTAIKKKSGGRGDVEDVQAAVTDPNITDENLDDRLAGIGLKLSLDPGEGVIRVAEIDLGGPCYHPVEVRHSQNVAHLAAQRRSSVPANTSSISSPVEIVDARQVEIGDILRAIDGQDVTGLRRNQIARMIVGRLNTPVVVRVAHEERDKGSHTLVEFDMLLKRDRKRAPSPTFFTIHAVGIEIAVCPDFTFEISKVITGSPAWDQGTLAVKDRIWMVSHEYCDHLRIYDVKKLFAASGLCLLRHLLLYLTFYLLLYWLLYLLRALRPSPRLRRQHAGTGLSLSRALSFSFSLSLFLFPSLPLSLSPSHHIV
jgi:hypothetical protein